MENLLLASPRQNPARPAASLAFSFACLLAALLGLWAGPAAAQGSFADRASAYAAQKKMTVSTIRFAETRAATLAFVRKRAVRLQKQEETPEQLIVEFSLPLREVPALDSLVAASGYVQENNLNRQNPDERRYQLRTEIAADSVRLRQLHLVPGDPTAAGNGQTLQEKRDRNEAALQRLRRERDILDANDGLTYVTLRLYDEISFPVANQKVNFVNMPGVEFGYLHVSNPQVGLSSSSYRGYSIKYLVTRGKSYFNLGIYKPVQPNAEPTDSSFINELAVINFGQDFYPRNFGRGKRRFLNLYTSYQLGGFIANRTDEKRNSFIPNVNLGMGVEVVKTKHVLFDLKGSYFVPLHPDSRHLRGLLFQSAFNFVF